MYILQRLFTFFARAQGLLCVLFRFFPMFLHAHRVCYPRWNSVFLSIYVSASSRFVKTMKNMKKPGMIEHGKYIALERFGTVWYGLVRFGTLWYALERFGTVWYALVCFGTFWYGLVWFDTLWYGLVRFGMVWCGLVRFGMLRNVLVRFGAVWCGLVRFGTLW